MARVNDLEFDYTTDPSSRGAGVSRRAFLQTLAAGAAAVGAAGIAGAQTGPLAPASPVAKRVLQPTDLQFQGWFRLPLLGAADNRDFMYASGAFASRTVGAERRFLMSSSGRNLIEMRDPESYSMVLGGGTPMAPLIRNWGNPLQGRTLTYQGAITKGAVGAVLHSYYWDGEKLWWQYGTSYNAGSVSWDPSLACTVLNDSTGALQAYGPWRTTVHSQQSRGWSTPLPDWFATQYCNGMTQALGSNQYSGSQMCPWGPNLHAYQLPNLSTPPDLVQTSDSWTGLQKSVPCRTLMMFDPQHRSSRPGQYRGNETPYDCLAGTDASGKASAPLVATNRWAETRDTTNAGCWIDLPDKHGVVWFASLCIKMPGYNAPGDADGLPHYGYGNAFGKGTDGSPRNNTCCHGQDDPWWGSTGPFCHANVPHVFIADPATMIPVAQGKAAPWTYPSTFVFPLNQVLEISKHPSKRANFMWSGNMVFDAARRLLFAPVTEVDTFSGTLYSRWAVAVFRIA